jgi:phage shock protein E
MISAVAPHVAGWKALPRPPDDATRASNQRETACSLNAVSVPGFVHSPLCVACIACRPAACDRRAAQANDRAKGNLMRVHIVLACLLSTATMVAHAQSIPNEQIDYLTFKQIVLETEAHRESRRLTEEDFIAAAQEPGVIVLDARSASAFALRRIKGAISLPFTDFTEESLAAVLPDKTTKILIYCNNNFVGSPRSFATKAAPASLNLSTYTSLRAYGYDNVYELGPVLNIGNTTLEFEGEEVSAEVSAEEAGGHDRD